MSLKQKKEQPFLITLVVDNSIEISNLSFTPKEFELTIKMIKNNLNYSLLGFEKITPAIEPKSNK